MTQLRALVLGVLCVAAFRAAEAGDTERVYLDCVRDGTDVRTGWILDKAKRTISPAVEGIGSMPFRETEAYYVASFDVEGTATTRMTLNKFTLRYTFYSVLLPEMHGGTCQIRERKL